MLQGMGHDILVKSPGKEIKQKHFVKFRLESHYDLQIS